MTKAFHNILVGEHFEFGGDDCDNIMLGPIHFDGILDVHAYHYGNATGGPNTAGLELLVNGVSYGVNDSGFSGYQLDIRRKIVLNFGTTPILAIRYANSNAKTLRHGLIADFTRTS